ncbi:40S ribosomal protein S17-like [Mus pahari]|uniref:40S ribosomal protein S17-like n=1 Tax=Mus pahari TaxID=10093 RepID=UPI000A30C98D|nr:40S ribosomal protein S17-like [Mus pahari]
MYIHQDNFQTNKNDYEIPGTQLGNSQIDEGAACAYAWTIHCPTLPTFGIGVKDTDSRSRLDNKGSIRTKTVKKAAQVIMEKYYMVLDNDFHIYKCVCNEIAIIPSKNLVNKIAGDVSHLMKQIQRGPERYPYQAAERRERRDNFVPEFSTLDQEITEVDPDTTEMATLLDFNNFSNLQVTRPTVVMNFKAPHRGV